MISDESVTHEYAQNRYTFFITKKTRFSNVFVRHPDDGAAKTDRDVESLTLGQYITSIYYESNIAGGQLIPTTGKEIQYKPGTTVKDGALISGTYRVGIVYEDVRGEDVYLGSTVAPPKRQIRILRIYKPSSHAVY